MHWVVKRYTNKNNGKKKRADLIIFFTPYVIHYIYELISGFLFDTVGLCVGSDVSEHVQRQALEDVGTLGPLRREHVQVGQ